MTLTRCLAAIVGLICLAGAAGTAQAQPEYRVRISRNGQGAVLVRNPDPVGYWNCTLKVQFVRGWGTSQMTTYRFGLPAHSRERRITGFDLNRYNTNTPPDVDLACTNCASQVEGHLRRNDCPVPLQRHVRGVYLPY